MKQSASKSVSLPNPSRTRISRSSEWRIPRCCLGEQPNIRLGVAMITSAPEAITLHEKAVSEMWRGAIKGAAAAAHLRGLLAPPSADLERSGVLSNEMRASLPPDVPGDGPPEKGVNPAII
ncbi:hypothetical protein V1281_006676 [Nitrobacteraceae bacterium AZCC 2161]